MMMKRLLLVGVASLAITMAAIAQAQDGGKAEASPSDLPPPGIQPDVWSHLQAMRQYESPRQIARMKAAEEAQQRRSRLSSQRWYGYTPLRPIIGATPSMGNYYPIWNTDVGRVYGWYGLAYPVYVNSRLLDLD